MFTKLGLFALLAPLVAGLTLQAPSNPQSGKDVTLTWTTSSGDPSTWTFYLTNPLFNDKFAVANNINAAAGTITFELPDVPASNQYTFEAVSISDITDVLAQTGTFSIGEGGSSAPPATGGSSSATGSGSGSSGAAGPSGASGASGSGTGAPTGVPVTGSGGATTGAGTGTGAGSSASPTAAKNGTSAPTPSHSSAASPGMYANVGALAGILAAGAAILGL